MMAKAFDLISPEHANFIQAQKMFFVGSAGVDGHVNISPKGYDSFRMLSPNQVAYLDLTGSGNETSAHLQDNNRMTYMFIALEGKPQILRLYGDGQVILPDDPAWEQYASLFDLHPGYRQIIVSNIHRVQTSCGYSIPFYTYEGERNTLIDWAGNKGEEQLEQYRKQKNSTTIDGITTPIGKKFADMR